MINPLFVAYARGYGRLPISEIMGAMEAEAAPIFLEGETQGLVRFRSDEASAARAVSRSSLSHFICRELHFSRGDPSDLANGIARGITLPRLKSFRLRVKRVDPSVAAQTVACLEREIGAALAKAIRARVDLTQPEGTFHMILSSDQYVLGLRIGTSARKLLSIRRNEFKPFSHHSTLQPEFCRVLVNLARVRSGHLVLDPFCGAGGILMEATSLGAIALGLDFKRAMVLGARSNMIQFGFHAFHLAVGDARMPPLTRANALATDPPYGRLSPQVRGRSVSETYQDLVDLSDRLLSPGEYVSLVCPLGEEVSRSMREAGLIMISRDDVKVHDQLTRTFMAVRK